MAAGLGFKDFVTGEVLTAADVDGYLMQGVWVFASAAARDAAVTSPQEGNFAYLKDTNVTTYYTGSAWANLDTTGMTNPMTTTGDTIYSSSGSTPARLGIGSTGQVLTVAAGVPSWAAPAAGGGMTLLSTTTLSGSGVTVSSINQDNKHLYLVLRGVYTAVGGQTLSIRFNGDTGSNYAFVKSSGRSSDSNFSCTGSSSTSSPALADIFASSTYSNMVNMDMTIPRYTESNKKTMFALTNQYDSATLILCQNVVMWNDTSAITSITLNTSGSTFSGGTLYIYGVN